MRSQHLRIETISTGRWLDRVTRLSQVSESKSSGACGRKISKDISKLEQTVKPHCCRSDKLLCVTSTLCCPPRRMNPFSISMPREGCLQPLKSSKDCSVTIGHWDLCLSFDLQDCGRTMRSCLRIVWNHVYSSGQFGWGVLQGFYYRLPADSDLLFRHPR